MRARVSWYNSCIMGMCARACLVRIRTLYARVIPRDTRARTYPLCTSYTTRHAHAHIPFMHELSQETRARTHPLYTRVIPRDTRTHTYPLRTSYTTTHGRIPIRHELAHELYETLTRIHTLYARVIPRDTRGITRA